jgi:hypothetical protein
MNNAEVQIAADRHRNARDFIYREAGDPRQGWRFGGQVLNEILYGFRWTLDFDGYSGGGIANRASKVPAGGETIDIRPESNSLHNAGNVDLAPHVHTLSARSLL